MLAGECGETDVSKPQNRNSKRKKRKSTQKASPQNLLVKDMIEWCRGRNFLGRGLLLLFFAQITTGHLNDPLYQDLFKGLNLGIHEIGHVVFNPFGEFMGIAGGSLLQCLIPLLSTLMFLRQRDYFAIAVCFGWLSTNLFDVATYAEDARKLELPLVSPFGGGGETIHDWNYMLDALNIIHEDYLIASILRGMAVISMIACLSLGFWLCLNMAMLRKSRSDSEFDPVKFLESRKR